MSATFLLQFLIFVQVFILGVIAVIGVQHYLAHYKPRKHQTPKNRDPDDESLPPELKQRLMQSTEAHFQGAMNHSVAELQHDLKTTTGHINNLVMRLATEIVSDELDKYRQQISKLHEEAEARMGGISSQVSKHQAEIEAKMAHELEAEKQRLIKQIDTKLGDAVGSFLSETLQHNVDLGSQTEYLVSMLEEHKADFVKEVGNETGPAG